MTRDQLEHILRAAHDISKEYDFMGFRIFRWFDIN